MDKRKIDSDQPWQEIDGVSFAQASDLIRWNRAEVPLDPADQSSLARAIREQWPDADPAYWSMIANRYRMLFKGLPEEEAVHAVLKGYSSPWTAMRAGVIPKRKYIGFAGVQP